MPLRAHADADRPVAFRGHPGLSRPRRWLLAILDNVERARFWVRIVPEDGDRHPIDRLLEPFPVRMAVLAGLLALALLLNRFDLAPLLSGTWRLFPASRYPWMFGAVLAALVAERLANPRHRRAILLALSGFCAFAMSPLLTLAAGAWLVAFHAVTFAPIPRWLKYAFVLATYGGLFLACDLALWPSYLAANPEILFLGYAFAVSFTFRIFYFLHEMSLNDFERVPIADFLLYFLFAPFFIVVPYLYVIPRFGRFARSLDHPEPAVRRSGLRYLAAGLAISAVFQAGIRLVDPMREAQASLFAGDFASALPLGLLGSSVQRVLGILGPVYFLVGLVRVLGIDLPSPFNRPLRSRSVTEWWRRWNVHFRDFLVDLFFNPLLLRWRRRNPHLVIWVGCGLVFVVGSVFFHWVAKHLFAYNSHVKFYWGIVVESLLMWILVAAGLSLEQRRKARGLPAPSDPPDLADPAVPFRSWVASKVRGAARALATFLVILLVVDVAGNGTTWWMQYRPAAEAHERMARARILALEGRLTEAESIAAGETEPLEHLVEGMPRDPVRRLDLAAAQVLHGRDRSGALASLTVALAFLDPLDVNQIREFREVLDLAAGPERR